MDVESIGSEKSSIKSFIQVMIAALTRPNLENYLQIAGMPEKTLVTPLLWLAGIGFVNSLLSSVLGSIFHIPAFFTDLGWAQTIRSGSVFGALTSAIAALFIFPIASLAMTGLIHLVSRSLGGNGNFEDLFYSYSAFVVPVSLINAIIAGIPPLLCLSIPLLIYSAVLGVLANQAVHGYETWRAAAASLGIPLVIFLILFACILILVALGVAGIAPIFEDILNQFSMVMVS